MQLMALNALLLFDAIFIFFLFLVSVSCLLYYLPLVPPSRTSLPLSPESESPDPEDLLEEVRVDGENEDEEGKSLGESRGNYFYCPLGEAPVCFHHHGEKCKFAEDQGLEGLAADDQEMLYLSPVKVARPSSSSADHPTTHILLPPSERKAVQSLKSEKPFPPVQTV